MSQLSDPYQSPLIEALSLLKIGDIKIARMKLGLPLNLLTDEEFIQGMISLEQGVNLFKQGKQPEAVEHFQKVLPIINNSTDEETKVFVNIMSNFAEGISRLLKGDAYGALPFLDISADAIERLSFFLPGLDKVTFSLKATSYIALARANLNAGDITSAESWIGKAYGEYEQLFALLDPENKEDIPGFVEIYTSRIEVANLFAFLDIQSLDLDNMEQHLKTVSEDVSKLEHFVEKIQPGPFQKVARTILILHSVLKDLYSIESDLVFGRSPVNKNRIEKLQRVAQDLFKAKEIAEKAGERGKGILYPINQLSKIRQNLLKIGKIGKEEFGRFAGIVSLCSLIVLIIVVHLTIRPSGFTALLYFLGQLILSLIVGFGYGAIRFRPLLKLYSEALKTKDEKRN